MMTYKKIMLLHFLQLAFAVGSVVLVLTASDVRLLIVCLLCMGIFQARFMVWWFAWIHGVHRFTDRLAGREKKPPKQSGELFRRIEVNLFIIQRKMETRHIQSAPGAPGVERAGEADGEERSHAERERVLIEV